MARAAVKGFSLIEVVIVAALLAMLLLLGHQLLMPSLRLQRLENSLAQAQQRLVVALVQVREILQSSGAGGIYSDGRRLSCQPVAEVAPDAQCRWQNRPRLIYHQASSRQLRCRDWTTAPSVGAGWDQHQPVPLQPADLVGLESDSTGRSRLLAGDISDFSVAPTGRVRLDREALLTAETLIGTRRTRWQMRVTFRNYW